MRFARLGLPSALLLPFMTIACSDPVPPTPRAAWSVSFVSPGSSCNVTGHNAALGEASVDDRGQSTLLNDGEDGADISCSVVGSSSFSVDATAYKGSLLKILIPSITGSATEENPTPGTVAFASANTQNTFASENGGCNFYFLEGSGEGVGSGKIWVAFDCPEVSSSGYTCNIKTGVAIFENCATSNSSDGE